MPDAAKQRAHASRGGGRAGHAKRRAAADTVRSPAIITRKIPTYELLGEEALNRIEAHADWILKEVGIEFRGDEEALTLFRRAGAEVTGERVRFEPGLAASLCATAPASFRMEARDPANAIVLGGDHVVLMPSYGAAFCQ